MAHHDLFVDVEPAYNRVRVTDTLHLERSLLDDGVLRFGLHPEAEISELLAGTTPLRAARVDPPPGWPAGVAVYEVAVPPKTSEVQVSSFMILTRSDGIPGAISQSGAWLPADAWWYPRRPAERCTYRWTVVTQAGWTVGAPGVLVRRDVEGSEQRQRWQAEVALPALDLALAPFKPYRRTSDSGLPEIEALLLQENDALAQAWLGAAERQLTHLSLHLGRFPLDRLTLVEVPDHLLQEARWSPWGSTLISSRELGDALSPDRIISRSLFKTWLGRAAAPEHKGDWRPAVEAWLEAEAPLGLALPPDASEAREAWLRDWREGLNPAAERPLIEAGDETPVRTGRGAMVLHMLYRWIGPQAFREGLTQLARGGAEGRTSWTDLRRAMEEATDTSLGWFFDPWLERLGAPRLSLVGVEEARVDVSGRKEPVRALQISLSRDGFTAPIMVPVVIELSRGRIVQQVPMDGPQATVIVPLAELTPRELGGLERGRMPPPTVSVRPGPTSSNAALGGSAPEAEGPGAPRAVRVDPDFDVLRELWPAELLPRIGDVLRAPAVPVMAGQGLNLVEDATLVATLMGRRTVAPNQVSASRSEPLVVVTHWSAVSGSQVQVGPLRLPLPRDLVVQRDVVWHRLVPYATAQVTAVLAVPHPAGGRDTVLLFITPGEDKLAEIVPALQMAHQAGFLLFAGDRPVARGRYEPGPNPLMHLMGQEEGPRLDEPAAW